MAAVLQCPAPEQLRQLVLGLLTDEAADGLERHVEHCELCGSTLRASTINDPLVEAMRAQAATSAPASDSSTLVELTRRLHELGLSASASRAAHEQPAPERRRVKLNIAELLKPPERDDEIGRLHGAYRVLELLGQGGMGAVFRAEDPHLQRTVALKVMLPEFAKRESARERFRAEARAAAKIEHDHIVTIFQVGDDDGVPFVAMQLLKGRSLEETLRRQEADAPNPATPLDEILRVGREIAAGLAAAHERGLVHRDIKPANIWLEAGGRVKIVDFGLAQAVEGDAPAGPQSIAGTAAYMAPEQARGEVVDARADLFSLGCVLYRLCAGREPWPGDDLLKTISDVAKVAPTPVREFNSAIPAELEDLVLQLLAKDREHRPQSARQVVETIERIERRRTNRPLGKPPENPSETTHGGRRRLTPIVGMLAAFAFFGFVGGLIYVKTDVGTLRIESFDDDVRVIVERNGEIVEILDKKQGTQVRLQRGEYTLRLEPPRRDIRIDQGRIEISRNGTVVAKIEKVASPPAELVVDSRSIVNSIDMKLASIPAGKFLMGSPATEVGRSDDEKQHEVSITRPFRMGVACVTVGQFGRFVRDAGYQPEGGDAWSSPGYEQTDGSPVGNVTWNDAVAFCEWLSKKEGRRYRLPTEAEWEYACRAGTQTARFFGDDPGPLLEYANAGGGQARPMSPIKPNPWGLYDMYGNQWQWTADWYGADYYEHSPLEDPTGPVEGTTRVMRGTSLFMPVEYSRSAYRHGPHPPSWYKPHVGFRVVLVDDAPAADSR